MNSEEMREEYEETVRKEFASIGKPEPDLRRNSTGDYVHATHAAAWWAWRASRASVAIELPQPFGPARLVSKTERYARIQAINECYEAIEAAGLKVKQ